MGKEGKDIGNWEKDVNAGAYGFIEGSEEIDLLHKGVQPGLQLCLVHVGSVHLLGEETHHKNEAVFGEAEEKLTNVFLATLVRGWEAQRVCTHLLQDHKFVLDSCVLVDLLFVSAGWKWRVGLGLYKSYFIFSGPDFFFFFCT